jgi:Ca-activated chloride channel family protein
MRLAEPGWLILLALIPLPWLLARSRPAIAWPTLDGFGRVGRLRAILLAAWPSVLRGASIACLAVALARPQTVGGQTRVAGQGVTIVVALDQSSSMNAADFPAQPGQPPVSRLEAARRTLVRFVAGRPDDPIGLVVFANFPDLACPPTLEHDFLLDVVRSVRPARPGDDGTNLGDAIVWSLDGLRDAPSRRKVLILLTDGRNSPAVPSPTDPVRAAEIARGLGVTLHTIAVGREGGVARAVEPVTGLGVPAEVDGPDLALLERLAKVGGGKSFVADDAGSLDKVFSAIDSLEKSPVRGEVRTRYREQYAPWAAAALSLLALDRVLTAGRLRRLP